jgi:hypothetical protein
MIRKMSNVLGKTLPFAIFLLVASTLRGQGVTRSTPLQVTRIYNITSTWAGECGAGVIDNRSLVAGRTNNYHSVYATGSGSWTVAINYSDTSCSGSWTSFGSTSSISQASNPPIAYANGNHSFIQIVVTGNASVTYSAAKDFFLATSVGSVSFPVTVPQGGTGLATLPLHSIMLGNGNSTPNTITPGDAGTVLTSNGPGADPSYKVSSPVSTDYDYAAQYPGTTLIALGSNQTITMTPCPKGIYANGIWAPVYLSGGTGTAEHLVPIGGTCTSGATTGTIILTPTYGHSNAYTVQSYTAGIQEAVNANPGKTIKIPPGQHSVGNVRITTNSTYLEGGGDPGGGDNGLGTVIVPLVSSGCVFEWTTAVNHQIIIGGGMSKLGFAKPAYAAGTEIAVCVHGEAANQTYGMRFTELTTHYVGRALETIYDQGSYYSDSGFSGTTPGQNVIGIGSGLARYFRGITTYNGSGPLGSPSSVSTASWATGTATYTVGTHAILLGQVVGITGITPSGYNVAWATVTGITPTTISVSIVSDPGSYSTGGSVQPTGLAGTVIDITEDAGDDFASLNPMGADTVIKLHPASGKSTSWNEFTAVNVDSSLHGIVIAPETGGTANINSFSNMWFSSMLVGSAISLEGTGTIGDTNFTGGRIRASKGPVISITNSSVVNFKVTGAQIGDGLDDGILIAAGSGISLIGNSITGNVKNGIHITGGYNIHISSNTITGNSVSPSTSGQYDGIRITGGPQGIDMPGNKLCTLYGETQGWGLNWGGTGDAGSFTGGSAGPGCVNGPFTYSSTGGNFIYGGVQGIDNGVQSCTNGASECVVSGSTITVTPKKTINLLSSATVLNIVDPSHFEGKTIHIVAAASPPASPTLQAGGTLGSGFAENLTLARYQMADCTYSTIDYSYHCTAKNRENVRDYGAKGDGSTDDTSAINSALARCPNATIYFPDGTYKITAPLSAVGNGCNVVGAGRGATVVNQATAGQDAFDFSGSGYFSSIQDMTISATTGTSGTAGWAINANTVFWLTVKNLHITGFPNGINLYDASSTHITQSDIRIMAPTTGIGLQVSGSTSFDGSVDVWMDHSIIAGDTSNMAAAGVVLINSSGFNMDHVGVLGNAIGLWAKPGTNQIVQWTFLSHVQFDTNNLGVKLAPTVSSIMVRGFNGTDVWMSGSQTGDGMQLAPVGGAFVTGVDFGNCYVYSNAKHGIDIAGPGTVENVDFHGCHIGGNGKLPAAGSGSDIYVAANQNNWTVRDSRIGVIDSTGDIQPTETKGIQVAAGTSSHFSITNNTFVIPATASTVTVSGTTAVHVTAGSGFDQRLAGSTVLLNGVLLPVLTVTNSTDLVLATPTSNGTGLSLTAFYDIDDQSTGVNKTISGNQTSTDAPQTLASATTLNLPAWQDEIYFVTGNAVIATLGGGWNQRTVTLIPASSPPFTLTTGGNIAAAVTPVQFSRVVCTYTGGTTAWYCSK